MSLRSTGRLSTTPPPRRRRNASRIGAIAAAAGTFLAFGALVGPVHSAQALPTGPIECSDANCVIGAFDDGLSFVLTAGVDISGTNLELSRTGAMTIDLGVHTLTVSAPNRLTGESSSSDGVAGGNGDPGESGLTVGDGAVLKITGTGTLTVAGGNGSKGGNGSPAYWRSPEEFGPGTAGGTGGNGGNGLSNAGTVLVGCGATLSATGGNGGDGGDGGEPWAAGFRNGVQGRAFLATPTVSDGDPGGAGTDNSAGGGYSWSGGAGGAAGDAGKGIANEGSLVSCGGAVTGVSGNSGSVTFDGNGDVIPATVVVYAATAADAFGALGEEADWVAPARTGSTFQGWYLGEDEVSDIADFAELALGTTVYAHWAAASSSSSFSPPPSSFAPVSSSSSSQSTVPTSSSGLSPTPATTPATTAASSAAPAVRPASLAIGVASSAPTASGGDSVTLTVNVTNPSSQDADDVQANLHLQPTMHFDGASSGDSGQGFRRASFALRDVPGAQLKWIDCAVAGADPAGYGGVLTCDLSGVLKAGAAAPVLLVKTTIRPGTPPSRIDVKASSQWTSNGASGHVEAAVHLAVPEAAPPALASTGVQTAWQLGLAGVLLAVGVGLMLVSRRRDDATLR